MPSGRIGVLCRDVSHTESLRRTLGESAVDLLAFGLAPSRPLLDRSTFDILLVDSGLAFALELCERLRGQECPRLIFVAAPRDDEWGVKALRAGAWGIVYRRARGADVVKAVSIVREGMVWAPRQLVAAALTRHLEMAAPPRTEPRTGFERLLSTREMEVFSRAAVGRGNKELANQLAISPATVKVHLTHIFQKLGVKSRAELAAAYHGLLPADEERTQAGVGIDFSNRHEAASGDSPPGRH